MRFPPSQQPLLLIGLLLSLACSTSGMAQKKKAASAVTFPTHIRPILQARCVKCHGGKNPRGGLDLTRPNGMLRGGKSGPALRINAAEFSLIYERITANEMPAGGPPLTKKEKGLIRTWINDGAKGVGKLTALKDDEVTESEHWSLLPPRRPKVPSVSSDQRRTAIDAFVIQQLQAEGLSLAPDAERLVLLRRACFDLLGLPPTPQQVTTFLADKRLGAYERLIERLLSHPAYGERWGRHWLDVAGYADSAGILNEDRPLPLAYRYRDYVIRAWNKDKPYDRFLQEQLAGDELTDYWEAFKTKSQLPAEVIEGITATGFLRTAPDPSRPDFKTIKNADALYFYPTIDATMKIVSSATMGLTIQCARCHSHKFDPIPQTDYYRLQAIFMAAYRPQKWIPQMERRRWTLSESGKKQADDRNAEVVANVKKLNLELARDKKVFTAKLFEKRLAALPADQRAPITKAINTPAAKRTAEQKSLAKAHQTNLRPDAKTLDKILPKEFPEYAGLLTAKQSAIAAEERRRAYYDEIRALYDLPGEVETRLLLRGDARTPGPVMKPGVPRAIKTRQPFAWKPPSEKALTSGRRLALAKWLTQPRHPLTSRVMVNRLWLHHFGEGLVRTPGDFGTAGAEPTHSELLDWLACEFEDSGWSLKRLHRLIMLSSVYRQRSRVTSQAYERAHAIDPDNLLLWRQRLRRLDAEPLRDAVLTVSGQINRQFFGYPLAMRRQSDGEVITADGPNGKRRSVYLQVLRLTPFTMLELFDQPTMETNCVRRMQSTVSLQALTLLNSRQMATAAERFAARLRMADNDPKSAVNQAVLLAFGRHARHDELQLLTSFVSQQAERYRDKNTNLAKAQEKALADLCQMLLSSNEFSYID